MAMNQCRSCTLVPIIESFSATCLISDWNGASMIREGKIVTTLGRAPARGLLPSANALAILRSASASIQMKSK